MSARLTRRQRRADTATRSKPRERGSGVWSTERVGQRLDRFGAAEPLTPKEMQEDWEYLRTHYPRDFTVSAEQAFAWHRAEAAKCLQDKNPGAALFHTLHSSLEWPLLSGRPGQ